MDMGLPSDERATLQALIGAAAPEPLPADQALALLKRLGDLDPEALGRLAYHALTGIDPGDTGDTEPMPPHEVLAGFPPFAAEVLMRAICGPDHRRPTSQALLIVLETVSAASWPTAGRPHVVAREDSGVALDAEPSEAPVEDPLGVAAQVAAEVDDLAPLETVEPTEPVTEPSTESVATPVADESRGHDEAFRRLLTPTREIPRFDPLSDPWEPEPDEAPVAETEPVAEIEPVAETEPETAPIETAPIEPEPVASEPEPEPASVPEPDPTVVPDPEPAGGMHAEFRNIVPSSFEVPRFERLEDAEDLVVLTSDPRRRSSGRRRATDTGGGTQIRKSRKSGRDRNQLLLLLAVIVVLVVLAVVYAASQQADETPDGVAPQGASRVMSHPVDIRS